MIRIARTAPKSLTMIFAAASTVAAGRTVRQWVTRSRSRAALSALSEHHLRDIGIDPIEARNEAARPFWR